VGKSAVARRGRRAAIMGAVHRLLPAPAGPVTPDELAAGTRPRPRDRPWVGVCMVASLDGSTVVDDRSGSLSSDNDSAVLAALRGVADAILVGAATVRHEGYGRPRKAGQRIGVVTATGLVDVSSDLFTSGAGFLVMPEDGRPPPPAAGGRRVDTVRAGRGRVDLAVALARLGDVMDAPSFVQVEGGSRLNGSLLDAGCLDELNLTLSPRLAGGAGPRVAEGAAPRLEGLALVQLAVDEASFLYGRWRRAG
jgi:riboflavin biosynthesis pyrimidine reductase